MNGFFIELRNVNAMRCARWHAGGVDAWTLCDWANAMGGEAGEAANAIKKLRRVEDDIANRAYEEHRLLDTRSKAIAAIGAELADTIIYADLLAARARVAMLPRGIFLTKREDDGTPIQRRGAWLLRSAGYACETAVMIELLESTAISVAGLLRQLERQIGEILFAMTSSKEAIRARLESLTGEMVTIVTQDAARSAAALDRLAGAIASLPLEASGVGAAVENLREASAAQAAATAAWQPVWNEERRLAAFVREADQRVVAAEKRLLATVRDEALKASP